MIRGNAHAMMMEVDGARVEARGGARLEEMMDEAIRERDSFTIFVFGVAELCDREGREGSKIRAGARIELNGVLERARGRPNWVLCTMFPGRHASQDTIRHFVAVNNIISGINGDNGNGSIALHSFMFYREGNMYRMKWERFVDDVHWDGVARLFAEGKIKDFLKIRSKKLERQAREKAAAVEEGCLEVRAEVEGEVGRAQDRCAEDITRMTRERNEECRREVERIRSEGERRMDEIRRQTEEGGRRETEGDRQMQEARAEDRFRAEMEPTRVIAEEADLWHRLAESEREPVQRHHAGLLSCQDFRYFAAE